MTENKAPPYEFNFTYSTESELNGPFSCTRILVWTILILLALVIPIIIALDHFNILSLQYPVYSYAVYILIFNSVLLIVIVNLIASSIAYPFGNTCFNTHYKRTNNARFGVEFQRCLQRMMRMVKESYERQDHDLSSSIFSGAKNENKTEDEKLDPKDIYMRVASNCELIELYTEVNQKLIQDNPQD